MSVGSDPANPVTESLLSRLEDGALRTYVEAWDTFERMAIEAYRDQRDDVERQTRYSKLRGQLLNAYPRWEAALDSASTSLAAETQDPWPNPFRCLLNISIVSELQVNWELMRCFPQAREALNIYLLGRLAAEDQGDA